MNPLTDILPSAVRRYVYALLFLASLVWTIYQASDGDWRQFVGGVIVALTSATAASNTGNDE
ncbi:hypothetical protein [Aeromicrobium sp. 9AM]|uniref:hypothetical protein n=1 Tax=Aeromicrobium sp. 9AM TaxID=2653126 RepID=UPI0012F26F20|nr:hypothetical protein [Aeromicrobium sp. 9AM]VXC09413.1 conserved hypothetical protein [Aeromicrobium sp. 9AM]